MADLKFIMDTDDESSPPMNKRPGHGSVPGHDPSPSSHVNPSPHDTTTTTTHHHHHHHRSSHHRAPSPPPAAAAASAAASAARPAPARRQSTASTESMDPHYAAAGYGGHGRGSSSSGMSPAANMPMRPMASSSSSSSAAAAAAAAAADRQVKLTPITRRVSRAKKGVPVHVCEECTPPKTFTRAEHLRRHRLSHGTPQYPCMYPNCDKAFHRQDLLARHAQRHNEHEDRTSSSMDAGGPSTRHTPSSMDDGSSSYVPGPGTGPPFGAGASNSPHPPSSNYASFESSGRRPDNHPPQPPSSNAPGGYDEYVLGGGNSAMAADFGSALYAPRLLAQQHDTSPWPSSASESNFSTPSADGSRTRPLAARPFPSPEFQMVTQAAYPAAGLEAHTYYMDQFSPLTQPPPYSGLIDMHYFNNEDSPTVLHAPFPSVRSLTPPTLSSSAQPVENIVTLSAAAPDTPALLGRAKGPPGRLPSGPPCAAAFESLPRPVRSALPRYVALYWERFDPLFPLVHRPSFESGSDQVLRCAVGAVATQFLTSGEDRVRGNILHEFASQEVRFRRHLDDLGTMQTILLCEFFARFRGRKTAVRPSSPFTSIYSRAVNHHTQRHQPSAAAQSRTWSQWAEEEARRRLLACCFVFDVHASVYLEQPLTHQLPTPLDIPLTRATESLWQASSLEGWQSASSTVDPSQPPSTRSETLTRDRIASAPHFDQAVLMALEILQLPSRRHPLSPDVHMSVDLSQPTRICQLFPANPAAYTYLALHFTPLQALLAVSGDSWLFAQKVLPSNNFQLHQKRLKIWANSPHAGVAVRFAANALLGFLSTASKHEGFSSVAKFPCVSPTATFTDEGHVLFHDTDYEHGEDKKPELADSAVDFVGLGIVGGCHRRWNMSFLSDYWAIHVCALICCVLGAGPSARQRRSSGSRSATRRNTNFNNRNDETHRVAAADEEQTMKWLHHVSGLNPDEVGRLGDSRSHILGVVSIVRSRLEHEAEGAKSRLLVDSVSVLKKLEDGATWPWL